MYAHIWEELEGYDSTYHRFYCKLGMLAETSYSDFNALLKEIKDSTKLL